MNIKKIKVKWNNGLEDEIMNQTYDPSQICEACDHKGAYFVDGDEIVGLCMTHIIEQYGQDNVDVI